VDPTNSEIHTNTIEGFFSHAKQYLRQKYGVDKEKVYEYLIYFIWIYKKEKNINTIINLINFDFSYFYKFLIFLKCVIFLKVCYKLRGQKIFNNFFKSFEKTLRINIFQISSFKIVFI
ncbi:hypothetical protein DMUE_2788, partial [Dictyocoela muelleri]